MTTAVRARAPSAVVVRLRSRSARGAHLHSRPMKSPAKADSRPKRGHDAVRREPALPGGLDHGRMQKLLGYNLAQAAIPSFRIFEKRIGEPFQLRRLDFTILMLVASNPQVTQRQMSLALDVSAPRLTIVCDKLVERELITRTRSEADRRKQCIALTRKGAALVRKADRVADNMEKELLGHLSDLEKTLLFQLLEKVAVHRHG
jgi:DNA-binding MarR family transcriptional regulator